MHEVQRVEKYDHLSRRLLQNKNATRAGAGGHRITLAWHADNHKSQIWFDGLQPLIAMAKKYGLDLTANADVTGLAPEGDKS